VGRGRGTIAYENFPEEWQNELLKFRPEQSRAPIYASSQYVPNSSANSRQLTWPTGKPARAARVFRNHEHMLALFFSYDNFAESTKPACHASDGGWHR